MSEKLKAEIIILEIGPDGQIFEDKVIPLDLARGILRETHIIVPKEPTEDDLIRLERALVGHGMLQYGQLLKDNREAFKAVYKAMIKE